MSQHSTETNAKLQKLGKKTRFCSKRRLIQTLESFVRLSIRDSCTPHNTVSSYFGLQINNCNSDPEPCSDSKQDGVLRKIKAELGVLRMTDYQTGPQGL